MKNIPARPTSYKGVTMRSRLEAGFAMWLDQMRWSWEYEPECFANEHGQWLPDFVITDIPCVSSAHWLRSPVYVEVKPVTFTNAESVALRARMAAAYDTHPNCAVVLVREGTNPEIVHPDLTTEPLDWTWTGLWPIDARRVDGPWPHEWWKGIAA